MSLLLYASIGFMLLIWIVSGGFLTQASTFLHGSRDDRNISKAYWLTFAAAFMTWFLIGMTIIVVILIIAGVVGLTAGTGGADLAVGAEEAATMPIGPAMSWGTILLCVAAAILIATSGSLGAAAAYYIRKSGKYKETPTVQHIHKAYKWCIIAACMCLVGFFLVVSGFMLLWWHNNKKKKEKEQAKEKAKEEIEEKKEEKKEEMMLRMMSKKK